MLSLAYVLCALPGVVLLIMALGGRPTRGEGMTAAHLVTGPFAIAFTLGTGLVLWSAPLPSTAANVAFALLLPGLVVGLTFLPLAAYGGRHARWAKGLMPIVVVSPFGLGHGAALHAMLPTLAAVVLGTVGVAGIWPIVEQPLRLWRGRLTRVLAPRPAEPSEWEQSQIEWHRGEWRKLPADAGAAALLPYARSLAPDVRTACHERLAADPDLNAVLAAKLRGPHPDEALWYITNHYPRSRRLFATPLTELLANLRATLPAKLRADPHPRPWTGDLVPAFECAAAVLRAGGDVRAELRAWQTELGTMPKFARLAKELARLLKKAG